MTTIGPAEGVCLVCDQSVAIVNHAVERGREVGYLSRHWRPGIARSSKCSGSFGRWRTTVVKVKAADVRPGDLAHRRNSDLDARPVEAVAHSLRPRVITLRIGSQVTTPIAASLYRFTREVRA